jgi:hypothetical protein
MHAMQCEHVLEFGDAGPDAIYILRVQGNHASSGGGLLAAAAEEGEHAITLAHCRSVCSARQRPAWTIADATVLPAAAAVVAGCCLGLTWPD